MWRVKQCDNYDNCVICKSLSSEETGDGVLKGAGVLICKSMSSEETEGGALTDTGVLLCKSLSLKDAGALNLQILVFGGDRERRP